MLKVAACNSNKNILNILSLFLQFDFLWSNTELISAGSSCSIMLSCSVSSVKFVKQILRHFFSRRFDKSLYGSFGKSWAIERLIRFFGKIACSFMVFIKCKL